jgi:type I restriction enzyme, S subunit
MAHEWRRFTLGELCSMITDGKHGDCEDQPNSGFYFLSVKDVIDNRLVYENARQITQRDFSETHRRTDLKPGDVLFTNTGTIGRMAIAKDDPRTYRTTFQKSVAILKPRRDLINPHFLYYLLHSDNAKLSEFAAGTTQKNLLLKDLRAFALQVPPLVAQESIARILRELDDKIELNRRMNETLEAIARAIFKSWFVDFDPVHAKAAGRQPFGIDAETAALFPSSFEDSPLGKIPKGWSATELANEIDFLEGPGIRNWQYRPEGIRFLNIRCIENGDLHLETANYVSKEEFDGKYSHFALKADDIVISTSGTLGRLAIVREEHLPLMLNTSIIRMRGRNTIGLSYLWAILQSDYFLEEMFAQASGSVQLNFGPMHLRRMKILRPPDNVLIYFERLVSPLVRLMLSNRKESGTLAAIRDALLPKLISGEIRIKASG